MELALTALGVHFLKHQEIDWYPLRPRVLF